MTNFPRLKIRFAFLSFFILILCVTWGQPQTQKTLTFEITVADLRSASEEELDHGHVH